MQRKYEKELNKKAGKAAKSTKAAYIYDLLLLFIYKNV